MHVPQRVRDFGIPVHFQKHHEDFFACLVGEEPHRQAQILPGRHLVLLFLHLCGDGHDEHGDVLREARQAFLQSAMNGRPGRRVTVGKETGQRQDGKSGRIVDLLFQQHFEPLFGLTRFVQTDQQFRLGRGNPRIRRIRFGELFDERQRLSRLVACLKPRDFRHLVDDRRATELQLFAAAARTRCVDVYLHRLFFLKRKES